MAFGATSFRYTELCCCGTSDFHYQSPEFDFPQLIEHYSDEHSPPFHQKRMSFTLDSFRDSKLNIHIVGVAAVEGAAIARFLAKLGAQNVVLHDFCEQKDFAKRFLTFHNGVKNRKELWQTMKSLPYLFQFANQYLAGIEKADLIFLNQAWYKYDFNFPKLGEIVDAGKTMLSSMVDLYLQLFPGKIIGVTGTHGKTTVTRLLGHVLNNCGHKTYVSGNDRHSDQILDQLAEPQAFRKDDFLVLEISNRQLKQRYSRGPDIAVITNIYHNHLDEHSDFDEYRAIKQRIADNQPAGSKLLVGDNDKQLAAWASGRGGMVIDAAFVEKLQSQYQLPITLVGNHNAYNAAFVAQISAWFGITSEQFQKAVTSFPGVEKRTQKIYQDERIVVINDLASTTPQATLSAVLAYHDYPLIVVLGGDDKNIPTESWANLSAALAKAKVFLLPGSINTKLHLTNVTKVQDWQDLMRKVQSLYQSLPTNQKETILLLSPAGEGFYTAFMQGVNLQKEIATTFAPQSV